MLIGQGACAQVKRATHKDEGYLVAIKQYDVKKLMQDMARINALQRESEVLARLTHPGIMQFYDSFESPNKINLVVEYINGQNLYQYIRKNPGQRIIDEEEVKRVFRQIVEAVSYMHSQGVVHRDLKLENVLLDRQSNQIKLIDFGFSSLVKSWKSTRLPFSCGTPVYMCPDMA